MYIENKHKKCSALSLDSNSLSKPIIKIETRTGVDEAVEKLTCIHC